jgi:hypothetical protein
MELLADLIDQACLDHVIDERNSAASIQSPSVSTPGMPA